MDTVLALRLAGIVLGVALFGYAEFRQIQAEKRPAATGRDADQTFNEDLAIFGLRVGGAVLVILTLLTWVIRGR